MKNESEEQGKEIWLGRVGWAVTIPKSHTEELRLMKRAVGGLLMVFWLFFFFLKRSVIWWKQNLRTGRCWACLSCIKRRIRYSWRQWKITFRQIPGWIPVLRYFSICVTLGNFIWAQFCYLWNRENYNYFVVLLWELNMIVHWKHYIHMRYSKKFSCLPSCHLCWEAITTA